MSHQPAAELSIDDLFSRAWGARSRGPRRGSPRLHKWMRSLSHEVREELVRRGFDVPLAEELDDQMAEIDGHADIWRIFLHAELLARTVGALARPFAHDRISKVIGIEARGFVLGGAVALQLDAGFAAVRKQGHLPGPKFAEKMTAPDYRGLTHEFHLQRGALTRRDRVLLVDDWIEMGSQAAATKALVDQAGATYVGMSVIVNQLPLDRARQFGRLHYLVRYFPHDEK